MYRNAICALVIACCLTAVACAAPIITAGDHYLLPDTPGQVIPILVSGVPGAPPPLGGSGDGFQGVDLTLTVNDGLTGPTITDIDLVGPGTVFFGNNTEQRIMPDLPELPAHQIFAMTTTATDYVGPNGTLAFVTLDTTGVASGDYDLHLYYELPGFGVVFYSDLPPFTFPAEFSTLIDGTLTVLEPSAAPFVPEPSTLALLGVGVLGLLFGARRRRKR